MKALALKMSAWLGFWNAATIREALLKDLKKAMLWPDDAMAAKAAYDAGAALGLLALMAPGDLR